MCILGTLRVSVEAGMRSEWMRGLAAALILSFGFGASASAETIALEIAGVRSDSGLVRIALYDRAENFPSGERVAGLDVAAHSGNVEAIFDQLPPGRYAIAFFHDEDGDGEFDTSFIGLPTEGYGFSNDAPVRFGPPSFDDAAIEVSGEARTSAVVRY